MNVGRIRTWLGAGVVLVSAAHAAGQAGTGFTINDMDTFFTQGVSPSGTAGPTGAGAAGAAFRVSGSTSTDHLFQNWWWYRINGVDIREFALANATGTTVSGNTATTTWTYPAFTLQLTYVVTDAGANAGRVRQTLLVTNTTNNPLNLSVFHYTDFDLNATAAGDSAVLAMLPNTMRITEAATAAEFEGAGADAYGVTAFVTLRNALADADIDNLNNTGLPFGPGDFTGAFQWDRVIPAGQAITLFTEMRINASVMTGACCVAGAACQLTTPLGCDALGGTFRGEGMPCDAGACGPTTGACCMNRCACMVMTRAECQSSGGVYQGDGTACGVAFECFPRPMCPCNWNGDTFVNSQDFFDFLAAFFALEADYNCDTFVNSQDFFDFVGCLLAAPTTCP